MTALIREVGRQRVAQGGLRRAGERRPRRGGSVPLSVPTVDVMLSQSGGRHGEVGVAGLRQALSWCPWPQRGDFDKQHASQAQVIHQARISGWPSLGHLPKCEEGLGPAGRIRTSQEGSLVEVALGVGT